MFRGAENRKSVAHSALLWFTRGCCLGGPGALNPGNRTRPGARAPDARELEPHPRITSGPRFSEARAFGPVSQLDQGGGYEP